MAGDITPYTSHITAEHVDKPKFMEMVSLTVQPFADMKLLFGIAPSLYDVGTAVGAQLDVVGQWVGVSRYLDTPLTNVYFALDDPVVGFDIGVWQGPYDPTSGLVELPDEFYRLLIYARILNNSWDGSKDAIYAITDAIFAPSGVAYYVEDYGDMRIGVGLVGTTEPPPILTALLNTGALDVKGVTIEVIRRVAQRGPVFAFDINSDIFKGFDQSYWSN